LVNVAAQRSKIFKLPGAAGSIITITDAAIPPVTQIGE
jgi:hypothetical protein